MVETILFGVISLLLTYCMFLNLIKTILQKKESGTLKEGFLLYRIGKNIKFIYKAIIAMIFIIGINIWAIIGPEIIDPLSSIGIVIILDVITFFYVLILLLDFHKIEKNMEKISRGEYDTRIILKTKHFFNMTNAINNIRSGMQEAVKEKVKSQKLKTDLIANVSHDLRTPLTSIINYITLIKKENIQNEKLNTYIEVLEKKSTKLKNLTDDLIDISKMTSGNEKVEMEKLDFVEMIRQANGEFAEKLEEKKLEIVSQMPSNEILVNIDGKKMWRVLENLYYNAYKYSLEGTRLYVNLEQDEAKVTFSLMNISKEKLNISSEELMERFVRGDSSRNTEGSGLRIIYCTKFSRITRRETFYYHTRRLI